MAKIAVGSVVEAYFVKLGAMLLRHRSENGITTSALIRRGGRRGKSDGGEKMFFAIADDTDANLATAFTEYADEVTMLKAMEDRREL